MARVWVREGYDLTPYRKVMVIGTGIQYRPVQELEGTTEASSRTSFFPLSEQQKTRLEEVIREEFSRALENLETLELVDEPGPDVLLVRGSFLDVVSRAPPDAGSSEYFLDSVGQATFVVELVDSQSEAVLIRAVDTRAAQTPGVTFRSSSVTNAAEARRLFSRWASLLVDALNDITTMDRLTGPST